MRIAQLAQEFEVLARLEGVTSALEIIRARRGRAYDPELTDLLLDGGADWWADLATVDPWDAALHTRRRSPRSTNTPCATRCSSSPTLPI